MASKTYASLVGSAAIALTLSFASIPLSENAHARAQFRTLVLDNQGNVVVEPVRQYRNRYGRTFRYRHPQVRQQYRYRYNHHRAYQRYRYYRQPYYRYPYNRYPYGYYSYPSYGRPGIHLYFRP